MGLQRLPVAAGGGGDAVIELRGYQDAALTGTRDALRRGRRAPILVAPTGSGKTVMASAVIVGAEAKGRRCWFVAHRFALIQQASLKLAACGIRHRIIAPAKKVRQIQLAHMRELGRSWVDHRALTAVGTVQTLVRRLDQVGEAPDVIILDECHLSIAPTYQKVVAAFPGAVLLGLTATPSRLDGKGLGKDHGGLYDELILLCQPEDLVAEGFLVMPRIFCAEQLLDMGGAHRVRGDWDAKDQDARVNKPKLIGDAVEHYRSAANGRPAMAFCASVKHAENTAEAFRAAGYRALAISGDTPVEEQDAAILALSNGELDVVCNCQMYIEGLDQPAISCILLLTQTLSVTRYLQMVGRGSRPHPGKDDFIILDHGGNWFIHGHPYAAREWSLDGTVRLKRKAANDNGEVHVTTCPKCRSVLFSGTTRCPECGYAFTARDRPIKVQAGNLVEITAELRAEMKAKAEAEKLAARRTRITEEHQCESVEELAELGRRRGYSFPHAWAQKKWATRKNRPGSRAVRF